MQDQNSKADDQAVPIQTGPVALSFRSAWSSVDMKEADATRKQSMVAVCNGMLKLSEFHSTFPHLLSFLMGGSQLDLLDFHGFDSGRE